MRDLDASLGFNFSRFNSNGWQNLNFDDHSQEVSLHPRGQTVNQQSLIQFQNLLNDPPRPLASIYNCIDSDQEEQGDIRQVEYLQNEPQARHVNSKQYFRMMKIRIKKVMNEYSKEGQGQKEVKHTEQAGSKRKYLYESRHNHATRRLRGKDGKFIATRPEHERFREKKKRGRKPKNAVVPVDLAVPSQ